MLRLRLCSGNGALDGEPAEFMAKGQRFVVVISQQAACDCFVGCGVDVAEDGFDQAPLRLAGQRTELAGGDT